LVVAVSSRLAVGLSADKHMLSCVYITQL